MTTETETDPRPSAPAVRHGATYRARPRRREFVVTVVDEPHRESGFDLTLDRVLDDLVRSFHHRLVIDRGAADYLESYDDQVVWQGNRVVAVVRFDGTG